MYTRNLWVIASFAGLSACGHAEEPTDAGRPDITDATTHDATTRDAEPLPRTDAWVQPCETRPPASFGSIVGEEGVWQNVTPPDVPPAGTERGDIDNWSSTILVDPARPSDAYVSFNSAGMWKSTDYGQTWTKVSLGAGSEMASAGHAWYSAIDRNPCRDPETPPTLYVTQGFGYNGVWKSTDGGVSWRDVWNDNIYAEDGVTNIYADVGRDVFALYSISASDGDHLLATLHSYPGDGDNNGIFESLNGGESWTVRRTRTFNFSPHSDMFMPLDERTWLVTTTEPRTFITTDSGASWGDATGTVGRHMGFRFTVADGVVYAGCDMSDGVFRSTDWGASWTELAGNQISWVVSTGTHVYAANGHDSAPQPTIFSADLDDDGEWTQQATPPEMIGSGHDAQVMFDGDRYVILAAQHRAGLWRYVVPSTP